MTKLSLGAPSSGLRVFSASLLSALMILMPFVQMAAASRRSEPAAVAAGPERTAVATRDSGGPPAPAGGSDFASLPGPVPVPLVGPVIVATKDDGLAAATTVAPGGTITYTVNINNNGTTSPTDDATNVQFSDTIDSHTTLVTGSPVAAVSDKYAAVGNTQLSVPDGASDLLGNDFDPDTGNNAGMTATAETKSSTNCTGSCSNNVTINANGSFSYEPPVGFTGTDTFTYTANSSGAAASETVTITVTEVVWYIKNDATACTLITSGCGTLSKPFSTLAAFDAVNDGAAGPPQHPKANDTIFIYTGSGDYTGGIDLLNGQKLIGQGATATLASIVGVTPSGTSQFPATSGTNPVLSTGSLTDNIRLGTGNSNLIRGFTVGNSGSGTGDSSDISGTSIGTLTVSEVVLNGTGRTMNINGGALSGSFASVATTATTGQGLTLQNVTGTLSMGSTTISGHSIQCISFSNSTANIDFGNTTCTGGGEGVLLNTNSAGTRTFGTLSITGGSAGGFLHSGNGAGTGGGDVNITGAATISVAGNGISVSTPISGDLIDFQAATSVTSTGAGVAGVFWSGAAGAEIKFNSLTIQTNSGTGLNATTGGTVTVTNNTGTINNTAQAAPAIVAANVTLNTNFSAIKSSGGTNGLSLTTVSGTSTFGSSSTLSGATGATFLVSGGTASVTYSGNITQATASQPLVSITGHSSGTITFQTGTLSATNGTGLQFDNADGTYNF
ncbi:MAG TPA: Ig-like domain-containing protein, partial [Pyrinomonadaceae bacterium]